MEEAGPSSNLGSHRTVHNLVGKARAAIVGSSSEADTDNDFDVVRQTFRSFRRRRDTEESLRKSDVNWDDLPTQHTVICSDHFDEDCFSIAANLRRQFGFGGISGKGFRSILPGNYPEVKRKKADMEHVGLPSTSTSTSSVDISSERRPSVTISCPSAVESTDVTIMPSAAPP
ncbi:hypothetical protein BSL78_24437 [Apostichopus japonicus]|uniref:THAP-type domain-containing protein n=1 Tax=Stichopus japonicus TaxID=307972 RepID=A0A2G8JSL4_STIJA|nr:hypothetical protein BSL78_24437 [Apostichopus japonicus]